MKRIIVLPILALVFTASLMALCAYSEMGWGNRTYDSALRETIGLPSIAVGTNYEGTRNPLLEIFVRSLYDVPGGHDYVVSSSFIDTPMRLGFYRESVPGFNMTMRKG
ncbi:MAG: hypothetical protein NO516_02105 [Candidatus Methanomethylicia archaeon]|mgnify:CR=1 FL=1|uniref:Uncharacterized protein n=1 Tax=Candidatus Methanomethylicus mesodigestus TaxID=1867258 RepID=A0A7C3J4Z6_9CREN|nr:hypothetical protein [Candidatus Methanomethylicia archaeon]